MVTRTVPHTDEVNIMLIALIVVFLVIVVAWRYGADTTDGRDWKTNSPRAARGYRRQHSPAADLRRVGAGLRRATGRSY